MIQPDMNTEYKQELYTSPEVEVIEVMARQVVCQSGGINDMNRDGDQSLDW